MDVRAEPLRRHAATLTVDDELLDDGPAVTAAMDALKQRFNRGLEDGHLVVHGEVRYHHHDYDPMAGEMLVVIEAMTYRDPVWVEGILADARRAVEEDQAILFGRARPEELAGLDT